MTDEPRLKRTDHGFRFGAALVTAWTDDGRGGSVIRILTEMDHKLDVRVTKSGQMRVYLNGLDCAATKGRAK